MPSSVTRKSSFPHEDSPPPYGATETTPMLGTSPQPASAGGHHSRSNGSGGNDSGDSSISQSSLYAVRREPPRTWTAVRLPSSRPPLPSTPPCASAHSSMHGMPTPPHSDAAPSSGASVYTPSPLQHPFHPPHHHHDHHTPPHTQPKVFSYHLPRRLRQHTPAPQFQCPGYRTYYAASPAGIEASVIRYAHERDLAMHQYEAATNRALGRFLTAITLAALIYVGLGVLLLVLLFWALSLEIPDEWPLPLP
ncbi:hypothetical protein Q8F55_007585 [Vanrija albida]|uniref:Uncharacterized protein n=1 Tax=Vanrija albida TaxID=181172 RepID=A0ABR3PU33_9TREE